MFDPSRVAAAIEQVFCSSHGISIAETRCAAFMVLRSLPRRHIAVCHKKTTPNSNLHAGVVNAKKKDSSSANLILNLKAKQAMSSKTALFVAAVASGFLTGCYQPGQEVDIEQLIHQQQFIEIVPPTTAYKPGNFVDYDPKDRAPDKVTLTYLCDPRDLFTKDFNIQPPLEDQGESVNFHNLQGVKVSVKPSWLKFVNLGISAGYAKEVKLTFKDVRLLQYPGDDLAMILDRIRRQQSHWCLDIVNRNIRSADHPLNAFQISQSLEATVDYDIVFKENLGADAKLSIIKELEASSLGSISGDISFESGAHISGAAIIYGLRWEQLTEPLKPLEQPEPSRAIISQR